MASFWLTTGLLLLFFTSSTFAGQAFEAKTTAGVRIINDLLVDIFYKYRILVKMPHANS